MATATNTKIEDSACRSCHLICSISHWSIYFIFSSFFGGHSLLGCLLPGAHANEFSQRGVWFSLQQRTPAYILQIRLDAHCLLREHSALIVWLGVDFICAWTALDDVGIRAVATIVNTASAIKKDPEDGVRTGPFLPPLFEFSG
jgi:hypothetical protein